MENQKQAPQQPKAPPETGRTSPNDPEAAHRALRLAGGFGLALIALVLLEFFLHGAG